MKAMRRIALALSSGAIVAFASASSALASSFAGPDPDIAGLPSAADENSIRSVITAIINAILSFLALIAVAMVIFAGIRLVLSQGEDDAKDKAKKTIIFALIGLVVVLFARVIVNLVAQYLASRVGGGSN